MTTLAKMMLDVARLAADVLDGTATGGSSTTLADTNNLTQDASYWKGGTLFMNCADTTAANDIVTPVLRYGDATLTFATQSTPAAEGTVYSVVSPVYTTGEIKQAVLGVLRTRPAEYVDETLTVTSGTTEYTLPSGVRSVRRVLVDGVVNQHWREVNGELVFGETHAPTTGTLTLIYCVPQGDIAYVTEITSTYDLDWLKWTAVVNLLRTRMNRVENDKPILTELMNEAKTEEMNAMRRAKALPITDSRLAD